MNHQIKSTTLFVDATEHGKINCIAIYELATLYSRRDRCIDTFTLKANSLDIQSISLVINTNNETCSCKFKCKFIISDKDLIITMPTQAFNILNVEIEIAYTPSNKVIKYNNDLMYTCIPYHSLNTEIGAQCLLPFSDVSKPMKFIIKTNEDHLAFAPGVRISSNDYVTLFNHEDNLAYNGICICTGKFESVNDVEWVHSSISGIIVDNLEFKLPLLKSEKTKYTNLIVPGDFILRCYSTITLMSYVTPLTRCLSFVMQRLKFPVFAGNIRMKEPWMTLGISMYIASKMTNVDLVVECNKMLKKPKDSSQWMLDGFSMISEYSKRAATYFYYLEIHYPDLYPDRLFAFINYFKPSAQHTGAKFFLSLLKLFLECERPHASSVKFDKQRLCLLLDNTPLPTMELEIKYKKIKYTSKRESIKIPVGVKTNLNIPMRFTVLYYNGTSSIFKVNIYKGTSAVNINLSNTTISKKRQRADNDDLIQYILPEAVYFNLFKISMISYPFFENLLINLNNHPFVIQEWVMNHCPVNEKYFNMLMLFLNRKCSADFRVGIVKALERMCTTENEHNMFVGWFDKTYMKDFGGHGLCDLYEDDDYKVLGQSFLSLCKLKKLNCDDLIMIKDFINMYAEDESDEYIVAHIISGYTLVSNRIDGCIVNNNWLVARNANALLKQFNL